MLDDDGEFLARIFSAIVYGIEIMIKSLYRRIKSFFTP
jgi:hypothetical protein